MKRHLLRFLAYAPLFTIICTLLDIVIWQVIARQHRVTLDDVLFNLSMAPVFYFLLYVAVPWIKREPQKEHTNEH